MISSTVTGIVLAAAAVGFLLAVALTALARPLARKLEYVDHPGGHKSHDTPTPYGGGVAIFLAAWLPALALLLLAALLPETWLLETFGESIGDYAGGLRERAAPTLIILAGGLAIHLLGLVDDLKPQRPTVKLSVMLVVALLVAGPGRVRIAEFTHEAVAVLITVAWIVVVINAFNFLDNMDGLSAGVACICLVFLVACGLLAGQVLVPALGCVFLGAIAGFLVFNFPPARIFMGDAGSLLVGYMIAVISILTTYYESGRDAPPFALIMPLVILAVPLYDFATVILIRLREGRSPMHGDQRHFSHRLVEHGLSRRFAVLTIYLATAATGLGATLLPNAGLREAATVAAIVAMVLGTIAILESPPRRNR